MRIETSEVFQCAPERLWAFLEEPEKMMQWMKGLERVVPETDGPMRVGSSAKLFIREGGKLNEFRSRITACDAPRHLALVMSGGSFPQGMEMQVEYTLTRDTAATRMDYLCVAELKGFFKAFELIGRAMARKQLKGFFRTLQGLVAAP